MNPYSIVSLMAAVIAFCTAIFIYQRNPGSRINLLVSGLAVTVSFTAFTEFVYRIVESPVNAYIWLKLSLVWPVIPSSLLHISLIYTERRLKPWMLAPIYAPAAAFISTGLSTDLLISGAMQTYYGWTYALPEPAVLFAAFAVWSIALSLAAALMVLMDYMKAEGYRRRE